MSRARVCLIIAGLAALASGARAQAPATTGIVHTAFGCKNLATGQLTVCADASVTDSVMQQLSDAVLAQAGIPALAATVAGQATQLAGASANIAAETNRALAQEALRATVAALAAEASTARAGEAQAMQAVASEAQTARSAEAQAAPLTGLATAQAQLAVLPSAPIANSMVHRVPGMFDDRAHGEPVGSYWSADGVLYQSVLDTAGAALWTPTVSKSPYPGSALPWSAVWGTRRLVQGYSAGKLVDLTRASDNTVKTISAIGDAFDSTTADLFCANTTCRYTQLYDQVGSSNITAVMATAPEYKPGIMTGNAPSIIADTNVFTAGLSPGQTSETMTIPGSVTTNAAAVTWAFVGRSTNGGLDVPLLDLTANSTYDTWFTCQANNPNRGLMVGYINTFLYSGLNCPISTSFEGFTHSASGSIIFSGTKQIVGTVGAYSGFVYAGGTLFSSRGDSGLSGNAELSAIFFRAGPSSAADLSTVAAAVYIGLGITPQKAAVAVYYGDSIAAGVGANDLQNGPRQMLAALNQPVEMVGSGYSGATRAALVGNLPAWAANNFDPNARANYWFGESGTNDLSGTVTAAQLEPLVLQESQAVTALGFRYIATTLVPRVGFTAAQEAQRQLYNTWQRANWRTYAVALDDLDANLEIRVRMNDAVFSPDGTHFTTRGYLSHAATDAQTLNQLMER